MKNLKAHHHLVIVSLLLFGMTSVWAWGTIVFASTSGTQVDVYVGPPDSCPNIPGYQMGVPNGMLVDGNGDCYTPPPPPVDMCGNIDGDQATIPDGYYRDDNTGNCYIQPTPPVDVCPNIDGLQEVVPDGYVNSENGDCVLPPIDVCENIPGTQILVPTGMEQAENKVCFTPAPIDSPNPPTTPDTPRQPNQELGKTDLKNIPAPLEDLIRPLVDIVPENVKEALRSVPPDVARSFPYYVIATLAGAATVMGWQSVREVTASRKLAALLRREREIAEEKDTFIALASHYLRTPLTLMSSALATTKAIHELTDETLTPLAGAIQSLETKVGEVLAAVEENTALKSIKPPTKETDSRSFLRSTFFWLPVVAMITIILLSNFLLGVVGEVELGTFNLITQTIILASVAMFFYSTIRSRHLRKIERAFQGKLLKHEETIDRARNDFIEHTSALLATELAAIDAQRKVLHATTAEQYFSDGYTRFEHLLHKFSLLGEIQAGILGAAEKFDIKAAINSTINAYQQQLDEKQLTIVNNVKKANVSQRRSLFDFVLSSLIDNAIKFSHEGGTIVISSIPHEKTLTVQVIDHGIGIPEEKMTKLFKPFSRGTSTMEFNYEGLGFSLFLDKIIMDYLGGTITAKSSGEQGTVIAMTTKTT